MHALFNPKAYFNFLNVNFTLSAFHELLNSTATWSTLFTFYDVWNAFWQCFSPFELRSCRLRPFSDVKRYNYILICVYCKAWNYTHLIKVKCSQLTLWQSRQHTLNGDKRWQRKTVIIHSWLTTQWINRRYLKKNYHWRNHTEAIVAWMLSVIAILLPPFKNSVLYLFEKKPKTETVP